MVMTLTGAAGKGIPIAGSWFVFFLARTPPSAKICNRKLDCSDDQAPVSLVVGFTMLKSSRQQARFQCGFAQTLEVVNTVCKSSTQRLADQNTLQRGSFQICKYAHQIFPRFLFKSRFSTECLDFLRCTLDEFMGIYPNRFLAGC